MEGCTGPKRKENKKNCTKSMDCSNANFFLLRLPFQAGKKMNTKHLGK